MPRSNHTTGPDDNSRYQVTDSRDPLRIVQTHTFIEKFPGTLPDGSMPVSLDSWLLQVEAICAAKGATSDSDFINEARTHITTEGQGDAREVLTARACREITSKEEFIKYVRNQYNIGSLNNPFMLIGKLDKLELQCEAPKKFANQMDAGVLELLDKLISLGWSEVGGEYFSKETVVRMMSISFFFQRLSDKVREVVNHEDFKNSNLINVTVNIMRKMQEKNIDSSQWKRPWNVSNPYSVAGIQKQNETTSTQSRGHVQHMTSFKHKQPMSRQRDPPNPNQYYRPSQRSSGFRNQNNHYRRKNGPIKCHHCQQYGHPQSRCQNYAFCMYHWKEGHRTDQCNGRNIRPQHTGNINAVTTYENENEPQKVETRHSGEYSDPTLQHIQ